jgi:hypothetical protein
MPTVAVWAIDHFVNHRLSWQLMAVMLTFIWKQVLWRLIPLFGFILTWCIVFKLEDILHTWAIQVIGFP